MSPTITKVCSGYYTVTYGGRTVEVVKNDEFIGPDKWIARAMWDRYFFTDPLPTYRDAKRSAQEMLTEAAQ